MRDHLKTVELKDLCYDFKKDIVDGPFGSNLKRTDYKTNGIRVLKIQNIKPFKITYKKMDYVSNNKFEELKRHSYENGDIIMTKLGDPLGASAIVEDLNSGLIVADLVRIRAKKINTKYLCYHLNSPQTQDFINSKQKGTTRPRVRISDVRELPIFTPPLPEQQRIVEILDQSFTAIDQAIENTISSIISSKEIFESFLNNLYAFFLENYPNKKLNEVCTIRPPKNEAKDQLEGNSLVSFAPMEDLGINQKFLIPNKTRKLNEVYSGYTYFSDNDVLLAKITPCFENGKLGIAKNLENSVGFGSSEYIVIRPSNQLRSEFLYYYLSRETFRNEGIKQMQGAVGHKRVPLDFVANYIIPIPPLSKQDEILNKIDNFFDNTNLLKSNYDNKKELLQELKQSILHKAFQGEL